MMTTSDNIDYAFYIKCGALVVVTVFFLQRCPIVLLLLAVIIVLLLVLIRMCKPELTEVYKLCTEPLDEDIFSDSEDSDEEDSSSESMVKRIEIKKLVEFCQADSDLKAYLDEFNKTTPLTEEVLKKKMQPAQLKVWFLECASKAGYPSWKSELGYKYLIRSYTKHRKQLASQ
ncbi:MAG: hypothetical protein MUO31_07135 [Thermodesulfovibrionales bacterium]|nr:hypothetical protein [Thermodesulfovibrionales bacterium]